MYDVPFLDLKLINDRDADDIRKQIDCVLDSGRYLLGGELERFEKQFAEFSQVSKCVGVASGLDALVLILKSMELPQGSEVILPANTFIASALAVSNCGLKPVPVDPDYSSMLLDIDLVERSINANTSAIMPVHLYGHMCDMEGLNLLANNYGLGVVEDAAQAHGASRNNIMPGMTAPAAFSFYPGKNLGGLGDGGAVVTDDSLLAGKVKLLRNYGSKTKYVHEVKGVNSRLGEIQAAILSIKLKRLHDDNAKRREVARIYLENIQNPYIEMPVIEHFSVPVWHLFVIKTDYRDSLLGYLSDHGVESLIHYPTPIHRHKCYEELSDSDCPVSERLSNNILSLPISPVMTESQLSWIIDVLNKWNP